MSWQTCEDGKLRCDRHSETFGPLEQCRGCEAEPVATTATVDELATDVVALEDEQWCRTQRDALVGLAQKLTEERDDREAIDRVGYSTVAKIYEAALKFHRCAMEERVRRGDKEHDRWLVKQNAQLLERRTAH